MIYGSITKGDARVDIDVDFMGNIRLKTYGKINSRLASVLDSIDLTDRPLKVLTEVSKAFRQ